MSVATSFSFLSLFHDATPPVAVHMLSLVKPDKAKGVENLLIKMASSRQLNGTCNEKRAAASRSTVCLSHMHAGRVDEPRLIQLLNQVSDGETKTKIVVRCVACVRT